ncbi:MAG: hypothetical protein UT32_C0007G0004 [Parcubacteria group bacterium GW2011_GWC2_39_14]|nr:MAG: hypothetical protein UT32_C0007G0004 [Parcubacteria group bacterium GW2011_GWC2_39_14]KKR55037.1 MAG: hypothetical protein UT91_C0005G0038 [Parcubacteria group bacterium GW2011_GWA2_40_23]
MRIEIDYCPTSEIKHFFISVELDKVTSISFDHTIKGCRIVKQVLIESISQEQAVKKYGPIDAEWDTLVIEDKLFVEKYHVEWIDRDKRDTVNGETWEAVWEKPLDAHVDKKLLFYSRLISDNYEHLNQFTKELANFETYLKEQIQKHAS